MNRISDHTKSWNGNHLLVLLLFTVACYWPLSFWIFSAKNDNITAFLPVRFQVSEALRSGNLPLWSPYVYLGFPVHGDMQGGAWNPLVWLLSVFGRYNLASLHAEIMVYIFLAGAGMYRLLGALGLQNSLRLAGAGAYLMSGYIYDVAGSNLPFLAAAAYIPFVLAFYYELLSRPTWNASLKTAISLWLLLVSGYPSFFICTAYIMLSALVVVIIINLKRTPAAQMKRWFLFQGITLLAFLLLSAPAIISYVTILPFYQRGEGVSVAAALHNSFHPSCLWSFLYPASPVKDPSSQTTDLISRNGYFNLIFLVFVFSWPWTKSTWLKNFIITGIVFFLLFSLGNFTPIRSWVYHLLPLMDTFRHPANARLFVILGGIVLGCLVWREHSIAGANRNYLYIPSIILAGLSIVVFIYSLTKTSLGEKMETLFSNSLPGRDALKEFFDALDWFDLLLVQSFFQIIFLVALLYFLRKNPGMKWWAGLILLNSFLLAQFAIPYTLASKRSPKEINRLIATFPHGFPEPDPSRSIAENSADGLAHQDMIGIESFYNKKITIIDVQYSPTVMRSIQNLMNDSVTRQAILSKPYAYFSDSPHEKARFELTGFSNNEFRFRVETTDTVNFCLQQVLMPGWKCFIDNRKTRIGKMYNTLMKVPVPPGNHELRFIYQPVGILTTFVLSLISLFVIIVILLKKPFRAIYP